MGITVIVNERKNRLSRPVLEAIGASHILAGLYDKTLSLWILSPETGPLVAQCKKMPVDQIITVKHECLLNPDTEQILDALSELTERFQPEVLVFPGEKESNELGARLAHRIGAGAFCDCSDIVCEDGVWGVTKSVYSGNLKARFTLAGNPAVIILKAGAFSPCRYMAGKESEVIKIDWNPSTEPVWLVKKETVFTDGDDLADANIVIVGGNGIGSKENLGILQELADLSGGVLGVSRSPVLNGWAEPDRLIGQSGKNISSKLCLLFGVSGASAFVSGITGAERIIAVNSDENAPIFRVANEGIVCDWKVIAKKIILKLSQ